jgi:hypothetical protein
VDSQRYLAWCLALLAFIVFQYALRRTPRRLLRVLYCYVLFSIFFGCVHFIIYRYNPTLYQVKETEAQSAARGQISIDSALNEDIKNISSTNVILLEMAARRPENGQSVTFNDDHKDYPSRYQNLDLETWIHTTLVGPERNDPVYSAVAHFKFLNDDHGIKKGTEAYYGVGVPAKMALSLEEGEFIERIESSRSGTIDHMNRLFEPGSFKAVQFSLMDFFYFAFSIVGVGEVIPASTIIRMLTLVQIIGGFILPLALDNVETVPSR